VGACGALNSGVRITPIVWILTAIKFVCGGGWASALTDSSGPLNHRSRSAFPATPGKASPSGSGRELTLVARRVSDRQYLLVGSFPDY